MRSELPGYELVTGIDSTMARVNSSEKQFDARIIGCTPDYFTVMGLKASLSHPARVPEWNVAALRSGNAPAATSASAMCGRPTGPPSGAKAATSSHVIG